MLRNKLAILFHNIKNIQKIPKRNSGGYGGDTWYYRMPPPLPRKRYDNMATGLGALCWWWIFYHCLTEPGHIFGEYRYVHPSTYTDEELGVPPDPTKKRDEPLTEEEIALLTVLSVSDKKEE